MNISELLTVVIPSRNEEYYIKNLLDSLRKQRIGGARVIIADCSTDSTRQVIIDNSGFLNIEIIDGGPVAQARNRAARLATTPYILFIDADVILFDPYVIRDALTLMESNNLDLLTGKIKCYDADNRAAIGFYIFNKINSVLKYFSPFAVGAFMLTRRDRFEEFGGFNEKLPTSEDYFLSRLYSPRKFSIINHYFGQDSRRFKKMGYFGMAWYLIKNFVYRNNPGYWNNLSHQRYWN